MPEQVRLALFEQAATGLQLHIADLLRTTSPDMTPGEIVALLTPGLAKLEAMVDDLLRPEARAEAGSLRGQLDAMGAPREIADRIVRLFELNGAVGLAVLGQKLKVDEVQLTRAYTKLGEALGLDWAQNAANHFQARDQWERLLTAGLARDFEQLAARIPGAAQERRSQGDGRQMGRGPGPAHRAVPPHRRPRPHRLGHHRADARPDRDPGAGAAGALTESCRHAGA